MYFVTLWSELIHQRTFIKLPATEVDPFFFLLFSFPTGILIYASYWTYAFWFWSWKEKSDPLNKLDMPAAKIKKCVLTHHHTTHHIWAVTIWQDSRTTHSAEKKYNIIKVKFQFGDDSFIFLLIYMWLFSSGSKYYDNSFGLQLTHVNCRLFALFSVGGHIGLSKGILMNTNHNINVI